MQRGYEHTQHGHLWLLLLIPLVGGLVVTSLADDAALRYATLALAVGLALLCTCFATLTVRDGGDRLEVRFGPLPVFGSRIRYDTIEQVRATRSRLIDGWGVHWVPGRGWTFNLWGFDCVEVVTTKGMVRIGTDDPHGLADFLLGLTMSERNRT